MVNLEKVEREFLVAFDVVLGVEEFSFLRFLIGILGQIWGFKFLVN